MNSTRARRPAAVRQVVDAPAPVVEVVAPAVVAQQVAMASALVMGGQGKPCNPSDM